MIRKYLSDIAIVSVFTLFAFLASDKPDTGYKKTRTSRLPRRENTKKARPNRQRRPVCLVVIKT